MAPLQRLARPQMYTIGWIAALPKELTAACAVLDEEHQKPENFKKHPRDTNNYAWGQIGEHNIVIASLAAGRYGTVSASTTAWGMISSLPHLRFGLMVGIGAGIPRLSENIDIRLGDIVVSHPTVHYGVIGSGNSVVKDGISRDEIVQRLGDKCICFEMEAAGLMDNFPCLVIRGICDYADTHKNDRWQNYAAATAAAFAKELLEVIDAEDVEVAPKLDEIMKQC
ncbi:hypothetical protein EsH8_VII_000122 [Colletotrichum jinshuiense]